MKVLIGYVITWVDSPVQTIDREIMDLQKMPRTLDEFGVLEQKMIDVRNFAKVMIETASASDDLCKDIRIISISELPA